MNKYEAETKKDYIVNNKPATAKEFIAYQINTSIWTYSASWKSETWVIQAKEDALSRLAYLEKQITDLKAALSILDGIEP